LMLQSAHERRWRAASRSASGESPCSLYPFSEDEGTRALSSLLSICFSNGRPKS
jgi:hypothetical protein